MFAKQIKTIFRHLIAPEEKSYYDVFEEINSETGTLHKSLWWANWLVWYSGVQKKPTKQCLMNEFEFYRVFGFQVIINNMYLIYIYVQNQKGNNEITYLCFVSCKGQK